MVTEPIEADPLAEVDRILRDSRALPVLFAGSGLSRRYLNTPTWDGLLSHLAPETGRSMPYYRGLAANDLTQVASLIAKDFYQVWFKDERYAKSRTAFESHVLSVSDPLKYEISEYLRSHRRTRSKKLRAEIEAMKAIRVHAVLTTNWDQLVEELLPDLQVYIGQQDILFSQTHAVGEIYKIHGCVSEPNSLVLTNEDYAAYWERNPYLIAKILTLFVEHPVIFMGYSLTDPHIQRLLANLISCLTAAQIQTLNGRLMFVRRAAAGSPPLLRAAPVTIEGHSLDVRQLTLDNFGDLYQLLATLPQHLSVPMLRRAKQDLYQLAFNSPVKGSIYTVDIDDDTELDRVEVVIGVGVMAHLADKGYEAFDRRDLFVDMLTGSVRHDPKKLLDVLLPRMFKQAKYAPVFYPLHLANRLNSDGSVIGRDTLPVRARQLIDGSPGLQPYPGTVVRGIGFRALLESDPEHAANSGVVANYGEDDVVALRSFLLSRLGQKGLTTEIAKLACKYDRLVYGPDYSGDKEALASRLHAEAATSSASS